MLQTLAGIQRAFDSAQTGGKKVSLADLIVLGGCTAVETAAKKGGHAVTVPFTPGRMDASPEQTDAASFAMLEPVADGFRNHLEGQYRVPAEVLLIDKAQLLSHDSIGCSPPWNGRAARRDSSPGKRGSPQPGQVPRLAALGGSVEWCGKNGQRLT